MPVAHDDLYDQSWNTNFGPNPIEDSPPDYTQNSDDIEYVPTEVPENNHPPSLKFPENIGKGSPVDQTTEREEGNHNEILQENYDDETKNSQKKQKKLHQKYKPKNLQKNMKTPPLQQEPINTRGEKYNLRPNSNPNYSDSFRYQKKRSRITVFMSVLTPRLRFFSRHLFP